MAAVFEQMDAPPRTTGSNGAVTQPNGNQANQNPSPKTLANDIDIGSMFHPNFYFYYNQLIF
jgi:hypothetical protein